MTGFAWAAVSWAVAAACCAALASLGANVLIGALLTALALETAAFFMIFLDLVAGLPFLMAVKPSERTEMSAVYSTFRDVSNVVTPAIGSLVLLYLPLGGVFVTARRDVCSDVAAGEHAYRAARQQAHAADNRPELTNLAP